MSPLLYSAISSAISPRDSQRKRAQSFVSPEFPRRVDRSDPIRRDPVRYRLVRYRHEARQPRVIAIAIAVPDCDSFYREPIDRVPNIDRSYDRTPRVFPSFIRFPGYPRVVGREKLEHGRIVECLPCLVRSSIIIRWILILLLESTVIKTFSDYLLHQHLYTLSFDTLPNNLPFSKLPFHSVETPLSQDRIDPFTD